MVEVGQIRIRISGDASSFYREMKSVQREGAAAGTSVKSSFRDMGASANGLNSLSDSTNKLAESTQRSDAALKTENATLAQSQGQVKQFSAAEQQAAQSTAQATQATDRQTDSLRKMGEQQAAAKQTAKGLSDAGDSAKKIDTEGSPALRAFTAVLEHAAEALAGFLATELGLKRFAAMLASQVPTFAAHGASVTTWADRLANAYRVVRLALAPTAFTAATIAAGVVAEKIAEATYREGGELEKESITSGLNRERITPGELQALDLAGGRKNQSSYLQLFNAAKSADLTSDVAQQVFTEQPSFASAAQSRNLRDIAEAMTNIKDPADRARAALAIFGSDGEKALSLLNAKFVENSDRVKDWGLVYSEDTRRNIMEFRDDIKSLGDSFTQFSGILHDSLTGAKMELVTFFAYVYAQLKGGSLTGVLNAPLFTAQLAARQFGATLPGPDALGIQSGLRGAAAVLGADVRGPGHPENGPLLNLMPSFMQLADEQTRREMQRNLQFDLKRLGSAGNFAQTMIGQSGTLQDLDVVNSQSNDLEGLRNKLSVQRERRSQIIREYFETGPDGKLRFKENTTQVQRASATESLISAEGGIKQTNAQIESAEKAQRDAEKAAEQAKQARLITQGKLSELRTDVTNSAMTLANAGQTVENPQVKAATESAKVISELDAVLARHGRSLDEATKAQIRMLESTKALNLAEAEWQNKLALTSATIAQRTRSQQLLTDAIGKGYEAQKKARVETQLLEYFGPQLEERRRTNPEDVERVQRQLEGLEDKTHLTQVAETTDKLHDQIEAEKSLSAVQQQGAEAVRLVTLAYRLRDLAAQPGTKDQIKAEIDLANAQKANASGANISRINQETQATERLTAAQVQGAAAVREAELQNRIEQIRRDVPAAQQPAEIQAVTSQATAQHQQEVTTEALRTGIAYQNQLESIDEQITALNKLKATQGDTLAIEISLHSLEQERTRVLSEQVLVLGTAKDGMQAFFREMASGAHSTAQDVHDVFASAFDGINDELAKLVSGQKTSWASFFQGISAELTKMALQRIEANIAAKFFPPNAPPGAPSVQGATLPPPSTPQGGLRGALAGIFGGAQPASGKRDGNTPASALFVTMAMPGTAPTAISGPASDIGSAGIAELGNAYRDSAPESSQSSAAIERAGSISRAAAQLSSATPFGGIAGEVSQGVTIASAIRKARRQRVAETDTPDDLSTVEGILQAGVKYGVEPQPYHGQSFRGVSADALRALRAERANADFSLERLPSGLIQRTPTPDTGGLAGLSQEDAANLGDFDNSELGELDNSSAGTFPDLGMDAAADKLSEVKGSNTDWGGLAIGIGAMTLGLLERVFNKPKNRHLSFASVAPFGDKSWEGFRAAGGPVTKGKVSVVGEKGPELFVPKESGTIIPNHKLSGFQFGGYRADGGMVSPSVAYIGGERGPELFLSASDSMANATSMAQRTSGGSGGSNQPNVTIYTGTNNGVEMEQRVRQGLDAYHASSVRTAVTSMREGDLRRPTK